MDRTKALYGPRTQAYGETKYKKLLLLQVLDRTEALYGPRTRANGETDYLDKKRFGFRKMGYLIKMSDHLTHGLNTIKG